MNVDSRDFNIAEHGTKWYSHKFKRSGLRYDVGICIMTGDIVCANEPYEPGVYNDIMIFKSHLGFVERVEADDGYIGEAPLCIKCLKPFPNPKETLYTQQRVRKYQETVNNRFKF